MKEDDAIESFFKGVKEADEHLPVPIFPKQHEPGRVAVLPVFLYAAATITAVVAFIFFIRLNSGNVQNDEMLILIGQDNLKTNSLIEEKSLTEWSSPTDFLAEDF